MLFNRSNDAQFNVLRLSSPGNFPAKSQSYSEVILLKTLELLVLCPFTPGFFQRAVPHKMSSSKKICAVLVKNYAIRKFIV